MTPELRDAHNYFRWVFSVLRPFLGKRILEIGAGYGNFASLAANEGKQYTGIDLDKNVVDMLNNKFRGVANVSFHQADITRQDVMERLGAGDVDTVISMNVLEHVENTDGHLKSILSILKKGRLIIFVPAHRCLYGTMDADAGHLRRYSKSDLRKLLDKPGLKIEKMFYFNCLGALGWFLTGRILKQRINSRSTGNFALFYDRAVIPLTRWVDIILNPFFGQSIICVADKT